MQAQPAFIDRDRLGALRRAEPFHNMLLVAPTVGEAAVNAAVQGVRGFLGTLAP